MSIQSESAILASLKSYVSEQLLDGQDIGLEPTTPLLEWGVLNSIEIARLVAFIKDRFCADIPAEKIVLDHFKDLTSIAQLVSQQLGGEGSDARPPQ